jgi:putative glutamine amidotransferase
MSSPIIGVTAYRNLSRSGFSQFSASENYIQAMIQAGACPLMIPPGLNQEDLGDLLSRLDGILFSGGGDIHPQFYGAELHPLVSDVDLERDKLELALLEKSLQQRMPILGICRGFQLINIGLGGSLYEDIQEQKPQSDKHNYSSGWPRDYLAHPVTLETGNFLAKLIGQTQIEVNSLHHQGIRQLAAGLEVLGSAPDGILEAVQIKDYPYGVAVQWHPEEMPGDPGMRALFRSFVMAAQTYQRK